MPGIIIGYMDGDIMNSDLLQRKDTLLIYLVSLLLVLFSFFTSIFKTRSSFVKPEYFYEILKL